MKKEYKAPEIKYVLLNTDVVLLTGSEMGGRTLRGGFNASDVDEDQLEDGSVWGL